jgi:hypothetical protein
MGSGAEPEVVREENRLRKRKREPGRRGGPGSLRRRKDVLSESIVTWKSRNGKSFKRVLHFFCFFFIS